MTFIDACWTFTETKQWILAQWGDGWCVSAVATATWKTSHVPDGPAQLSHHDMKSVSISVIVVIRTNWWITTRELCTELNIGFSALVTMVATLEYRKVCARWVHECSYRNIKNTVCKFVRTYWTNTRLKVTVSWIAPSPVTRHSITITSRSQAAVHGVATCEFPIEENVQDAALSG